MLNFLIKLFAKLFTADKWNIGYVLQTPAELISQQQIIQPIIWIKEDNVDYAADPFVTHINDKLIIYYEELNFWTGKGEIMMIDALSFQKKKKVFGIGKCKIHLSYPYLYQFEGSIYCIPETAAAKEVGLYLVNHNKLDQLEKIRVLIQGKKFVDSSMVYYEGKHWLFCTIENEDDKLYIFYAHDLTSEFKAHTLNPITSPNHGFRSAGDIFNVDNVLFWPTQNSTKKYGGSISINRIDFLSPDKFKFKKEFELSPSKPYLEGLHNISFSNGFLVLDGKRKIFSLIMPLKKLVRKMRS